jgi:hypothetical protein
MLAGGAGMTASASASDGTGSSATAGVSAGADLSGGVERSMTASNVSATPPGNATHPPLRNAEMTGSRNRWTREAGWGGNDGSGASPFHSHKPGSWFASLGDVVWDDTITAPPQDQNAARVCIGERGRAPPLSRCHFTANDGPSPRSALAKSDLMNIGTLLQPSRSCPIRMPGLHQKNGLPKPPEVADVRYMPRWRQCHAVVLTA